MPNVVTYCRVSSEEQAQKDISIPAQRKAILRWIQERPDLELAAEFVDEGESAYAPADRRPGFGQMISYCRKNDVDAILVHKLDRFSRNREESILFKGLLRKHGVQVRSITENYDPETPQGFLYEGMIEVINQFYSMNLATETLKGMRENAERGYHNGGRTPYGYAVEEISDNNGRIHRRLVLGPEEQVATIQLIFEMAVQQNMGSRSIASELNKRGIRPPQSRHWNASTIKNILHNPVYVGDLVWMKHKKQGRDGRTKTPEDSRVVIRDAHPALVSREDFEQHRTMSKERHFDATPNPTHKVSWLLSRLIRCDHCGNTFVGRRHSYHDRDGRRVVTLTYNCGGYLTKGRSVCRSLPIEKEWLEDLVVGTIRERLTGADAWAQLDATLEQRIEARRQRYGNNPRVLQRRLEDLDTRIQNFYRAIGEGLDPVVCQKHIAELTAQKEALSEEAAMLQREDYYTRAIERNRQQLGKLREAFHSGFNALPFGIRRQIVLACVEEIRIEGRKELVVRYGIPFDNAGVSLLADDLSFNEEEGEEAKIKKGATESVTPSGSGFDCHPGTKWLPSADRGENLPDSGRCCPRSATLFSGHRALQRPRTLASVADASGDGCGGLAGRAGAD